MFLLVLDEDPITSANLVPDKLKFKQLLELGQLICSAGISDVYKPIRQGKAIQEWVKKHPEWVAMFYFWLKQYCIENIKGTYKTFMNIELIYRDIYAFCYERRKEIKEPLTTAIFRYSKDYQCNIPTNTELPIDECIKEYKQYVEWKKLNNVKGYQ
jgi:hypothetical protein